MNPKLERIREHQAARQKPRHRHEPRQRSGRRRGLKLGLRMQVLRRDGFRCTYCGATPDRSALHVDHVLPVASGGRDELANLRTACADCNLGKRDKVFPELLEGQG